MKNTTGSMRLGKFEFFAMNNPIREWRMRRKEIPLLIEMLQIHGIELSGKTIIDMGCGSGYGTGLLLERLKPSQIIAFDLMPEQIKLAQKRNLKIDFKVGDATSIKMPDHSCDAVFEFGILHHIPAWKIALQESARVLVAGGTMLIEEPHKLFKWDELELGIQEAGFKILERRKWYGGFFRFFLAKKI